MTASSSACPCGSGQDFDACCGPVLAGAPALTAEALMRSRYTAYTRQNLDHIANTNAVALADVFDRAQAEEMAAEFEWLGLQVLAVADGGADDATGTVEFRSAFRRLGQDLVHHELAHFTREEGRWVYSQGDINPKQQPRRVVQVGRNDPCPCGSGKKFKKCCGA